METTAEDFDTQQLLQAHIAEMDSGAKMFKKRELTWLVRGFEHCDIKAKFHGKSIHKGVIQPSFIVECTDSACALTGLNDELYSPGIEPVMSSCNCFIERFLRKGSLVFLAHLVLYSQPSLVRQLHDCARLYR